MNTVQISKEYTPLRQFYAWVGVVSLVCIALAGVYTLLSFVLKANAFIDAALQITN